MRERERERERERKRKEEERSWQQSQDKERRNPSLLIFFVYLFDKSKEPGAAAKLAKTKAQTKKVDRMEESLKDLNRDLSMTKMKSMFAVGISMIGLFGFLNNMYVKKKKRRKKQRGKMWRERGRENERRGMKRNF